MSLDDSIGFLINQTGRRLTQLLNSRFAPYGVTAEQWSVLARLCEEDGINQKNLAFKVGKDQTNLTRILDQLERKGLIARRSNPEDRRSHLPCATGAGASLFRELAPIEQAMIGVAAAGIPESRLEELRDILAEVTANVNRELQNG